MRDSSSSSSSCCPFPPCFLGGMRRPKYAHLPSSSSSSSSPSSSSSLPSSSSLSGGLRRPKYAILLSCSLSLFSVPLFSVFFCLFSLSFSFSLFSLLFVLSFLFFSFLFFLSSLSPFLLFFCSRYLVFFLFARLGMACSSSGVHLRGVRRLRGLGRFFALLRVVALVGEPKSGSLVFLVSCLGFRPRIPNLGPFCFLLFSLALFRFLLGSLPLRGRVCAEFQIYPGTISEVIAGGRGVQSRTTSNEAT